MTPKGEHEKNGEVLEFGETDLLVLDLDRTTIKSDDLSQYAYKALLLEQPENPERANAIAVVAANERKNKGSGYEYLRHLDEAGVEIDPEQLAEQILAANQGTDGKLKPEFVKSVMVEGAVDFIKAVSDTGASIVIQTAGDQLTQRFKIALVQAIVKELEQVELDSFIITEEGKISKARMLERFYDPETEEFQLSEEIDIPGVLQIQISARLRKMKFNRLTLIDDKDKHFDLDVYSPAKRQMRFVHSVAVGMDPDDKPRVSMTEAARRVPKKQ